MIVLALSSINENTKIHIQAKRKFSFSTLGWKTLFQLLNVQAFFYTSASLCLGLFLLITYFHCSKLREDPLSSKDELFKPIKQLDICKLHNCNQRFILLLSF